jgi:hypothetical protein
MYGQRSVISCPSEAELEVHDLKLGWGGGRCLSQRLYHYQFLEARQHDDKVMLPEMLMLTSKQGKIA